MPLLDQRLVALLLTVCTIAGARSTRAAEVSDETRGFTFTIPDDFRPDDAVRRLNPDFLYAFRRDAAGAVPAIVILERMHGTLGLEPLDPKLLPAGSGARFARSTWNGFEVETIELSESQAGVAMLNLNTQLPLRPEAIQLRVVGAPERAADLRALNAQLLAGLRGDSNWLRSAAPPAIANSRRYATAILVGIVAVVLGLVAVIWLAGRRSRRGTMLGLALLVWTGGALIPIHDSRELRGLQGAMKMAGAIGLLLGLADLAWHPARRDPASPSVD